MLKVAGTGSYADDLSHNEIIMASACPEQLVLGSKPLICHSCMVL